MSLIQDLDDTWDQDRDCLEKYNFEKHRGDTALPHWCYDCNGIKTLILVRGPDGPKVMCECRYDERMRIKHRPSTSTPENLRQNQQLHAPGKRVY